MGVLEKTVEVTTTGKWTSYYREKGYDITGAKSVVAVEDLPRGSTRMVTPVCDECGRVGRKRKWCLIYRDRVYGRILCADCLYDINVLVDTGGTESTGEMTVKYWLEANEVPYRTQVRRKGVTGASGGPLLFDFAVLDKTGEPVAYIEYDGEQHYRPVSFGGEDIEKAKQKFAVQQEHDRRKNRYCESIGVPMIRIRYDASIEDIRNEIIRVKEVLLCD
ncbi:hypothetical protein D3C71_1205820 [compost metagenome]